MKVTVIILNISVVVLGIATIYLSNVVGTINETTGLLKEYTDVSNENTISREHRLQDSLEERIGTLEREVSDLKLVLDLKGKK